MFGYSSRIRMFADILIDKYENILSIWSDRGMLVGQFVWYASAREESGFSCRNDSD